MPFDLTPYLPFLIPLAVIEVGLTIASLIHVLTHKTYRTGNRVLWVVLSFVQIIGPVLYFIIGRDDGGKD
ncbi:MAG: PLD nuclease N-terminal domain-containing protein [Oscillospiraceae bacterium]|jgi:heme/copper-type cytochrome/quinol oxidase subunit 4|nr:PLD nuclease N-terminal domain-containing protein [Oscillospiraceae bacterium]